MRYLVTGAAGFLGSHVIDLLLSEGKTPRALIRPGEFVDGLPAGRVDISVGDLADRSAMEAAVRSVDIVLHCAARTGPWGPESEFERSNVVGLRTLVAAALEAGVRRIVHVSSAIVHGNDVRGAADETAPIRVERNPYSRTKVAGEALVQSMIRDRAAPITVVRPGLIYGPRDTSSFGRFAAMVERGQMVMIGSGRNHVPLIYVTDVARGVFLACEAEAAEGRTYLLVNDEPVTQRDYLQAIAAELGAPPPHRTLPYRLTTALGAIAEGGSRLQLLSAPPPLTRFGVQLMGGENRFVITRARRELGFTPQVMLAEGVKRSVGWYRAMHEAPAAANGHA